MPGDRHRGPPPGALIAISVATMAVISVVDILSPPDIHLGPLLAVAPTFVAGFTGPRLTTAIGVLSVLALVCIGLVRGVLGTENLMVQVSSLVLIAALLALFTLIRERNRQQSARVRAAYAITRRSLLPPLPDHAGPLHLATRYHAAADEADLGGDLYALTRTPTGTRILIGDVRGKGLASLDALVLLVGSFRAAAHRYFPLPDLVADLEATVRWGLTEHGDDPEEFEHFVTAAVLELPDDSPEVHLVSCGHPPPLLIEPHRVIPLRVDQPAPPLGLGDLASSPYYYAPTTFVLPTPATLLLYTDGLTEARDRHNAFYPLNDRAAACLNSSAPDPAAFLDHLWTDLTAYTRSKPSDDVALIAIHRPRPAAGLRPPAATAPPRPRAPAG